MRLGFSVGAVVTAMAVLAGLTGTPDPAASSASAPARAGTFISLWPACACGRRTELDAFSLRTGRRLAKLGDVPVRAGETVTPAAVPGGPVLLSFASGPKCMVPAGGGVYHGPCDGAAGSCTGRLERLSPRTGRMQRLIVYPPSRLVLGAVPSPDGHRLVMPTGDCATSYFNLHLAVRDLSSGRQWTIGSDAPRCHGIDSPSWSPDGSRIAFVYAPSVLPYGTKPSPAQRCQAPRAGRLVVVSSARPSSSRSWKLINPDRHCSFLAAAFARRGMAAVEACHPGPPAGANVGHAYLVSLDHRYHVTQRMRLERGWEEGRVSTDFRDGSVIISQDQPANAGYPEFDWVWQDAARHLRLVGRYRANDAAQVIASPW